MCGMLQVLLGVGSGVDSSFCCWSVFCLFVWEVIICKQICPGVPCPGIACARCTWTGVCGWGQMIVRDVTETSVTVAPNFRHKDCVKKPVYLMEMYYVWRV